MIGPKGLALIKEREGYHRQVKDGSGDCVPYRCPAGVLTLGYGCTEGIYPGMRWTHEQAEAALFKEIAKHEAVVDRLVTVPIEIEHRDALCSLSYNIGASAFEGSTVLKRLNAGQYDTADDAFLFWSKYTPPGSKKKVESRGLKIRRQKEAALFNEGTAKMRARQAAAQIETADAGSEAQVEAVEHVPPMPQAAVETRPVPVGTIAAVGGTAAATVANEAASPTISWTDTMTALNAVPAWMAERWWLLGGVALIVIVWRYLPSGRSA